MCVYTVDIYRFYMNTVIIVNTEQKALSLKITYTSYLERYYQIIQKTDCPNLYIMHIQWQVYINISANIMKNCLFNFASSLNNIHYGYSLLKENCFVSTYILFLRNNCLVSKLIYTKKIKVPLLLVSFNYALSIW